MNIDTVLLRSFTVLAEELHFARAAERLFVEQPALSQRIKRLESRVGFQLFTRSTRAMSLTPAGAGFLVDALDVLDRLDGAVARGRELEQGKSGGLALGYTLSVGYETLPTVLSAVANTLPDMTFEALEMWEIDVFDAVRRRSKHVGFVRCDVDPDDHDLNSVLVRRERLVLAVPDGHRLVGRRSVSLTELGDEQVVTTPRRLAPGYQDSLDRVFARAGVSPDTTDNPVPGSRVMSVLQRSPAVSLVPESAELVHPRGVGAFIPLSDDFAVLSVRLVYRTDAEPKVLTFVEAVQQLVRPLGWI